MEEANIMFEIHKFDKAIKDMEFNYNTTKEEHSVLRDRVKANEENIFKFNHNLKTMKDAFLLKLSETYQKLFEHFEEIQKVANRADQQSKVNKGKINVIDAQIQSDRKQLDSQFDSLLKLESKIETINQVTVKERKHKEDIVKLEEEIKLLEVKMDTFINTTHTANIEHYVHKYLPAQVQVEVTQELKGLIPPEDDEMSKKFKDNVINRIRQTRDLILNDDESRPEPSADKGSGRKEKSDRINTPSQKSRISHSKTNIIPEEPNSGMKSNLSMQKHKSNIAKQRAGHYKNKLSSSIVDQKSSFGDYGNLSRIDNLTNKDRASFKKLRNAQDVNMQVDGVDISHLYEGDTEKSLRNLDTFHSPMNKLPNI